MKEKYVIGKGRYSIQELFDIWQYFRENGVPDYGMFGCKLGNPSNPIINQYRADTHFKNVIDAFDNFDLWHLAIEYFRLDAAFKKVCAELQLKNRGKPLTKEQFDSKAYEDYLKDFNEETERLKKIAGIEEEEK